MNERETLAAEYALGLLEGEELLRARGLAASDAGFAAEVERWGERLAPMLDEIDEAEPPESVWLRLQSALAGAQGDSNVVALRRKLGFWKGVSAAAAAAAASLALVVAYDATRLPPLGPPAAGQPAGATMVAAVMAEDKTMVLSAAWRPADNSLMIMPGAMQDAPGHSHELWIIPADGRPRSLGLVTARSGEMPVDPDMAPHFSGKAKLAISVEPAGGSRSDLPTGPVVATGELQKV